MKKNITLLFLLFVSIKAFSQQEAQFSHNMFNNMAINPGYAGSNDALCATLLARQQWVGFKGAGLKDPEYKGWPKTYLLSIDAPVNPIYGGLGLTIIQDQLGFEKNLGVKISYAYRLSAGPGKLGIGAQVGFLNKKIDFSQFIAIDPSDPVLQSTGKEGDMAIDFALGLFYKIPNKLYFGLSASQLRQADIQFSTTLAAPQLARHYYVTAGYYYPINSAFELDPSLLIKSDFTSTQFDINALLKYNNRFWGGVSYRATDAIVAMVGMYWNGFRIGYSYDITTSAIKNYSGGSHEIMLGYCLKLVRNVNPESYKNPRFL